MIMTQESVTLKKIPQKEKEAEGQRNYLEIFPSRLLPNSTIFLSEMLALLWTRQWVIFLHENKPDTINRRQYVAC